MPSNASFQCLDLVKRPFIRANVRQRLAASFIACRSADQVSRPVQVFPVKAPNRVKGGVAGPMHQKAVQDESSLCNPGHLFAYTTVTATGPIRCGDQVVLD